MAHHASLGSLSLLAPEVRNQIYRLALPYMLYGSLVVSEDINKIPSMMRSPNLRILLASKGLNAEASAVLFSHCNFKISFQPGLGLNTHEMNGVATIANLHRLRHLKVKMSSELLFEEEPSDIDDARFAGYAVTFMAFLAHLANVEGPGKTVEIKIDFWFTAWELNEIGEYRRLLHHPKVSRLIRGVSRLVHFKEVRVRFIVESDDEEEDEMRIKLCQDVGKRLIKGCEATLGVCTAHEAKLYFKETGRDEFSNNIQFVPNAKGERVIQGEGDGETEAEVEEDDEDGGDKEDSGDDEDADKDDNDGDSDDVEDEDNVMDPLQELADENEDNLENEGEI
ncbi:uncharacterized protein KY384_003525 [Bacidia gigantensis]|uniref:uncharacterized protein n=1 Tax=Bacidia gigantensis TaxID=2732470 RepID=UPI001D03A837|nr:uncharacterized protein KY384_003525 [Bacidia gigantensis]KAG8531889.1 hypothetical protein KY384_003525 [Bacidia gigantensis]